MLSAFGRFNKTSGGGGGGGCCPLSADLTSGGGGVCCPLSADSISEVSALSADPVILSVGGGCCPLSVRMYVNFYYKRGGGGGGTPLIYHMDYHCRKIRCLDRYNFFTAYAISF